MNFMLTVDTLEEFFKRVSLLKEDTIDARLQILEDMKKERLAFAQTDEQVIKRLKGKKVTHVRRKPD